MEGGSIPGLVPENYVSFLFYDSLRVAMIRYLKLKHFFSVT